jgi:predicted nicotinamide N-methyase
VPRGLREPAGAAGDRALNPLTASLAESLRDDAPASLLDVFVCRVDELYLAQPRDWEALREDEAVAQRGVPYWARLWPSGRALARAVLDGPPLDGVRVLELGCGLGLPSVAAARRGADVVASDVSDDAAVFAAHNLALNSFVGEVVVASWAQLADRGSFDLVLAADVLYLQANVESLLRVLPRLVADGGEAWIADPDRRGGRDFLAAARKRFTLTSERFDGGGVHRLS